MNQVQVFQDKAFEWLDDLFALRLKHASCKPQTGDIEKPLTRIEQIHCQQCEFVVKVIKQKYKREYHRSEAKEEDEMREAQC
ncbi:MAG: hypothetical protein KGL39_24590 [Patescibacteria group bacterium]|nr:hypothetical protein [Patescibacteria group bacterium]